MVLDFKNSDLSFISSLTYSSTLSFIYGFQIHGHDVADVVKNPPRVLR